MKEQEKKAKKVRPSSAAPHANKSSNENSPNKPSAKDDAHRKTARSNIDDKMIKEAEENCISVEVIRGFQKPLTRERDIIEAVMHLVLDIKLTNEPSDVIKTYQQNKARCSADIQGGETEVSRVVRDFFSNENTV